MQYSCQASAVRSPPSLCKTIKSAYLTALFGLLGFLLMIVNDVIQLRAITDPRRFTLELFNYATGTVEDVIVVNGNISIVALLLAYCCFALMSMLISLTWIDIAVQVCEFFDQKQLRQLNRLKCFIKVYAFLYSVVTVFLIAKEYYNAVTLNILLATIVLVIFYIIGSRAFLRATAIYSENDKLDVELQRAIKKVKYSTWLHIAFIAVVALSSITFFILSPDNLENIAVEDFNYALFSRDVWNVAVAFMFSADTFYVRTIFVNLSIDRRKKAVLEII